MKYGREENRGEATHASNLNRSPDRTAKLNISRYHHDRLTFLSFHAQ